MYASTRRYVFAIQRALTITSPVAVFCPAPVATPLRPQLRPLEASVPTSAPVATVDRAAFDGEECVSVGQKRKASPERANGIVEEISHEPSNDIQLDAADADL